MTAIAPTGHAKARDPICLVLSAMLLIALYVAVGISAAHGSQPEGGTPSDIGKGIQMLCYVILAYFVGFTFAIASSIRGEGYRRGVACIIGLYILPLITIPILSMLGVK